MVLRFTPFFLFLYILFVPISYGNQAPDDHLHGLGDCSQCHLDGVDISKIMLADHSCPQCHLSKDLKLMVKKLANGDYSRQSKQMNSQVTVNQHKNNEMFYAQSRIGTDPGPMKQIPAATFVMGTDERLSDEGPPHEVSLSSFYIDVYEVTNGQYKLFIDKTKRKSPSHFRNRTYPEGKIDHPVTYVNWHDANAYCQWAGKRLPTDKEWEFAARSADQRTYPWGNDFEMEGGNTPVRWKKLNKFGDTTPVGMFPKGISPFGLFDMSGNVWEWTSSWYKAYPGNKVASESYGERYKTLKGGSWFDCSFYKCGISAPVYNRAFFAKKVKNDTFGFRCAK